MRRSRAALIFTWDTPNKKGAPMGPLSYLARPERLIQIAFGRSSPLRGACGVQNANAFCRTAVLIMIQNTQNKKGAPMGPLLYLARPERFELPTARFVVRSLHSNALKYNKVRWGARCMKCPAAHNGAGLNHAKLPQASASITVTNWFIRRITCLSMAVLP